MRYKDFKTFFEVGMILRMIEGPPNLINTDRAVVKCGLTQLELATEVIVRGRPQILSSAIIWPKEKEYIKVFIESKEFIIYKAHPAKTGEKIVDRRYRIISNKSLK